MNEFKYFFETLKSNMGWVMLGVYPNGSDSYALGFYANLCDHVHIRNEMKTL